MPISLQSVFSLCAAVMVLGAASQAWAEDAPAAAPVAPSSSTLLSYMLKEPGVVEIEQPYKNITEVMTVYYTCPDSYNSEAMRSYAQMMFTDYSQRFMDAFKTAHEKLTTKLPSAETVEAYRGYIANSQQETQARVTAVIAKQGCSGAGATRINSRFQRMLMKYMRANPEQQNATHQQNTTKE